VVEAWRAEFEGEIEDGPRVWNDLVLVAEHRAGHERYLHVLDLRTGKPRFAPRKFKVEVPLRPSLWEQRVAVRAEVDTIRTYEIDRHELRMVASAHFDRPVSGPLLFGHELYVRVGDDLVRHDPSRPGPNWRAARLCVDFEAEPTLRGGHVYVFGSRSNRKTVALCALDRADGSVRGRIELPRFLLAYQRVEIQAGDRHVALRCDEHRDGLVVPADLPNALLIRREGGARVEFAEPMALSVHAPFAFGPGDWLGWPRTDKNVSRWMLSVPAGLLALTDPKTHAEWLEPGTAPSRAGGVAMIGRRAFDIDSRRVLWVAPLPLQGLAIPADGFVLGRVSDRTLVALAPPDRAPDQTGWAPRLPDTVDGARVVMRTGELLTGALAPARDEAGLMVGPLRIDRRAVLGILDAAGLPLLLPPPHELPLLVHEAARTASLEDCLALLPSAVQGKDPEVLERALGTARALGADESDLKVATKALERLRKQPSRPNTEKVAAVEAGLAATATARAAILRRLIAGTAEALPFEWRAGLLEIALRGDPDMAEAVAAVRGLLPAGLRATEPFDAAQWLDFARASRVVELAIVEPGDENDAATPYEERELARCRRVWRADLFAVKSPRLFVVAPYDRPGSVARCVSLGELVCSTLDRMFAGSRAERHTSQRLKVFLYGTPEEYQQLPDLEEGQPRPSPGHLQWTAGHHSPLEEVSRMFLPADDDGFEMLHQVFAHELTHHWVEARCPLFTRAQRLRASPEVPGFWIVEGFAELLGNARYDLARREVELLDPYDGNLDLLSNAGRSRWLSWKDLFAASEVQVKRNLDARPGSAGEVAQRFRLGVGAELSRMNLFYAQAGAAVEYLFHADGGAHREALLKYVGDHYAGQRARWGDLDVQAAFGISAKALGAAIQQWARDVAGQAGDAGSTGGL
jgi:hypothetical protein